MRYSIHWFRQDLRLQDNPALTAAAADGPVLAVYLLDDTSAGNWRPGGASRWWLHHSLASLQASLAAHGIPLLLRRGNPQQLLPEIAQACDARSIHWNRCYEPFAIARDRALKATLTQQGYAVHSHAGSLLFEPQTIQNRQGGYFKVFTPFWKHCMATGEVGPPLPVPTLQANTAHFVSERLEDWGLLPNKPDWASGLREQWKPGEKGAALRLTGFLAQQLAQYASQRDIPAAAATSCLSPHLHFGEISPRQVWHAVQDFRAEHGVEKSAQKFLAELGWREFSYHLLYHFPELPTRNFRPEFDDFPWREHPEWLQAWQQGRTGIPIVDAGMRELWRTGNMHNRVRMLVASFLTKNLRLHWHHGAAWFWDTLVDADLASNSASWQWVAGSGADAAPYFRIFNPVLQSRKFDPEGVYLRRWLPELQRLPDTALHAPWETDSRTLAACGVMLGKTYPLPLIDLKHSREDALAAYAHIRR